MNCWEFKKCGREPGGEKEKELGSCPAYPDKGKICAEVADTLCAGKVEGTSALRLEDCAKCGFYKSPHYKGRRKLVEGYGEAPTVAGMINYCPEPPAEETKDSS